MADVQQAHTRARQLRKLTEISRALTYVVTLEDVLRLTVRCAADLLNAERVVLMMQDEHEILRIRAAHGLGPQACRVFEGPLHETLITRLKALLGVDDSSRFLGVPLVVSGNVTGLLAVKCGMVVDDIFDEEEWLLSALADQAAVALEKTRLDETAVFRERLIGIVSHDLRNPVAAICLSAEALLRRSGLDEPARKSIRRIQGSAERAQRMIHDLLDFTQVRLGGGMRLAQTEANLHPIVEHMVQELSEAHPERAILMKKSGDDHGSWDIDRLAQAISNLLRNALQYGSSTSPIVVETKGESTDVTVSITNQGDPIPASRLDELFEPLHRATQTLDTGQRSVGLGLYIVKHIAEAHGGTVAVRSTAQEGTTFVLSVPRVEPHTDPLH